MQKKLLVLGGTGSCGRHFVQHALNHGHLVRLFTRNTSGITTERFSWANHNNLETFQGDLTSLDDMFRATEGMEAVVSLAGPPLVPP